MFYNVRRKRFPNGREQYQFYEIPKEYGYSPEKRKHTGLTVERKEVENARRAVQKVYDYAHSNSFDYFLTLTFDGSKIDRYSYDACADALKMFTDIMRHNGNKWLIVPEQHKDGAYHFHALVSGSLSLVEAINPHTGQKILDKHGRQVYNVRNFKFGHTTATGISDPTRAATYIAKYLTKDIQVPKGRKRYWASRSLCAPIEERLQMTAEEYGEIFNSARYQKVIDSPWGHFLLCET